MPRGACALRRRAALLPRSLGELSHIIASMPKGLMHSSIVDKRPIPQIFMPSIHSPPAHIGDIVPRGKWGKAATFWPSPQLSSTRSRPPALAE